MMRLSITAVCQCRVVLVMMDSAMSRYKSRLFLSVIAMFAVTLVALGVIYSLSSRDNRRSPTRNVTRQSGQEMLGDDATEKAVRRLKSLGVVLESNGPGPQITHAWIATPQVTDDDLDHLKYIRSIRFISITAMNVTDAGLRHLSALPNLRTVCVRGLKGNGAGFRYLRALEHLGIDEGFLGDADLRELVTNNKGLTVLELTSTKITNGGLAEIGRLSELRALSVAGSEIDDSGLENLREMKLYVLDVGNTNVTDEGMRSIVRLESLRELNLRKTSVSDVGLAKLATLKSIVIIDIRETNVTKNGVEDLRKKLPDARIIH